MAKCEKNNKNCRVCKYRYPAGSELTECPVCGEPRKCRSNAVTGFTACRMHGAGNKNSPGGRPVIHGKYSKYLTRNIASRYEEALEDPLRLELDNEIAIARARLTELLERADTGESASNWYDARNAYKSMIDAIKAKDDINTNIAMQDLNKAIGKGVKDYSSWAEIRKQTEHYVKLVESQRKRQVETQQMITIDQLMMNITATLEIVKRVLFDKHLHTPQEQFNALSHEFNRVFLLGNGEEVR